MEERYEDNAEFGHDDVLVEDEIQDEPLEDSQQDNEPEDIPSDSDEGSEEEQNTHKKRDKAQTRINQLQREKYRALHQAEKLAQEADYWKQRYDLSSQVAIRLNDANVSSRLDKARAAQIAAIESGDAQAQADATREVAAATAEMQDLNNWKYQDQVERNTRPQQPQPVQTYDPEVAQEWMQDNQEWINPQSNQYDEELTRYIVSVDNELANALRQRGAQHIIGTSDYFHELDNHREAFLKNRNNYQKGELNMQQSRGGASPVRGNPPAGYRPSRQEYRLSPHEREMARAASKVSGCKEDVYLKEKIRFMKEEALANKGGR